MRLPLWLDVAATCAREILRAAIVPFELLLTLPRRGYWRAAARAVLGSEAGDEAVDAVREALLRRHPPRGSAPVIFVSAGEPSGERHACRLLDAVAAAGGRARWIAFGGEPLRERGCELRYPLAELAVMGLAGVFAALPRIVAAYARFVRVLRDDRPDLCVLVDYPGLHLVMAEAARRRGVPVVHYVAPQYWAWGPWRMRRYRRAVDATLTILPFEAAFFAAHGVPAAYVGHPLLDSAGAGPPHVADDDRPVLCLMPGSRRKEIRLHLPGMLEAVRALPDPRGLRVVVPQPEPRRRALVERILAGEDAGSVTVHDGPASDVLAGARAAFVKSGTGSLEACLHGVPTAVVYVLAGAASRLFVRLFLNVPWIASANLICGRRIVPEILVRGPAGWRPCARELAPLLADSDARAQQLRDLAELRRRLGAPGASARVARLVLPYCQR